MEFAEVDSKLTPGPIENPARQEAPPCFSKRSGLTGRMMSSSFSIQYLSIATMLLGLLISGSLLAASVLLIREGGPGPKLMVCGAVFSLLAPVVARTMVFWMNHQGSFDGNFYLATVSITTVGPLLFAIGFLLFALGRRRLAGRVAELESILSARDAG
jgi:hypothetical protein